MKSQIHFKTTALVQGCLLLAATLPGRLVSFQRFEPTEDGGRYHFRDGAAEGWVSARHVIGIVPAFEGRAEQVSAPGFESLSRFNLVCAKVLRRSMIPSCFRGDYAFEAWDPELRGWIVRVFEDEETWHELALVRLPESGVLAFVPREAVERGIFHVGGGATAISSEQRLGRQARAQA